MSASPPLPKRIKIETPSPSVSDNDLDAVNQGLEQEHCTICLQSFLDRTIIPLCAHEFCFECILLWLEQSRKCPLCSRPFVDSYLIHHIRSQYDYQKHYLPPQRSSPQPFADRSRANISRNARRERQWGRTQRQQREEADQLEQAIVRRRWIYQHHLYAKHVASNPYTRYRPFPTPAQFAASPDHISRMTTFLRRELRVWPNLDVEFLTTYTTSLMKSIDIRSESAVKLLSELLDLDTPYAAGERHANAEHFAHEIYSYLRSPYRDLNMYDQAAQYDTPPGISPPQEIESGNRWSFGLFPSRRSRSRSQSPVQRREHSPVHSPTARRSTDSSAEARRVNYRHSPSWSPRGQEDQNFRNHPSDRKHSPPDGVQDTLRNGHSEFETVGYDTPPAVLAEVQDNNFPVRPPFRDDEREIDQVMEAREDIVAARDTPKFTASQGDDSAAALTANRAGVTRLIGGRIEGTGSKVTHYVDKVRGSSSANTQPSRKRSPGLDAHVHPRNRTLLGSIQAYLSRPGAPGYTPKNLTKLNDKQPARTSGTSVAPGLFRLANGPTTGKLSSNLKITVERTTDGSARPRDDAASSQSHHECRPSSCIFSSSGACFSRGGRAEDMPTLLDRADGAALYLANERLGFTFLPGLDVTSTTNVLALAECSVDRRPESVHTPSGILDGRSMVESSLFISSERTGRVDVAAVGDVSGDATFVSRFDSGSSSASGSTSTWPFRSNSSTADVDSDMSALEMKLRARARVRARLRAIKGAVPTDGGGTLGVSPSSEADSGAELTCKTSNQTSGTMLG